MDKDLIKMRDILRETANIIDELLELEVRETSGQEVIEKETESVAGRFMFKMMELNNLSDK